VNPVPEWLFKVVARFRRCLLSREERERKKKKRKKEAIFSRLIFESTAVIDWRENDFL
jgi:hypothetical protein